MKNKIIEMFDTLCLPFGNGHISNQEEKTKDNKILELVGGKYIEGVGIYIPSVKETKKVVVSHMDLVRPFQNGFIENKKFFIEGENLRGALDNTITNACLVLAIKECSDVEDVAYLFTEGEETGLTGMRNFMRTIFQELNNPFFINLDVTNEFYGLKDISVEFDKPNLDICYQIGALNECGYTHMRFCDDTSAILSGGGNGFSFCIPTDKYCHTYDSTTKISSLEPYYKGLISLIKDVDFSDYVHDMETLKTEDI